VIPCCADLSGISNQSNRRESMRAQLGLQNRTVLVYVGKFGGWYKESEMVDFFAAARTIWSDLHFLCQLLLELLQTEIPEKNLYTE